MLAALLQQFDYHLKYVPGKPNGADYLSRQFTESDIQTSESRKRVAHCIMADTTPQAISQADIQAATKKDPDLEKLVPLIQTGNHRACKSDPDLVEYAQVFQELSYIEGVVTRGHQIVITKTLQVQIISICHEGHLGIVKTKQLLH